MSFKKFKFLICFVLFLGVVSFVSFIDNDNIPEKPKDIVDTTIATPNYQIW